jgi:hypothetical protein
MADLLQDARYALAHAKRRAAEFQGEVAAFLNSNPYAKVIEQNADGTEDLYKIKLVKPMPIGLRGVAFDTVNSLRAALDQAGFAAARAAGNDGRDTHFPFRENISEMQGTIKQHARGEGRSKDIPAEIFAVMVAFQPYKGGNDLLWALNKLCNTQKHEIVVPMALRNAGGVVNRVIVEGGPAAFGIPAQWDSAKQEMILVRVARGVPRSVDIQVDTFIAIGKVDGVEGQPAIGILNGLTGVVERITSAIEAEATRIGLTA